VGFNGGTPEQDHGLQWAQCRQSVLGHQWLHQGLITDDNELGFRVPISMPVDSIGYRSQCSYCTTTKVKWMSRRGFETLTRYHHPQGYSRRGDEALDAGEWRTLWIVNALGDLGRPEKVAASRKRRAS
jgi:hypothetical protein